MRVRYLVLFTLIFFVSCVTTKKTDKHELPRDEWHGRFLHVSGKYELILNHFAVDSIAVDLKQISPAKEDIGSFFADIQGDQATWQDRPGNDCKFVFQKTSAGILFSDLCHRPFDDSGLYKYVGDK